jgi:hypothetical protein
MPPLSFGRLAVAAAIPISLVLAGAASADEATANGLSAARELFHEAENDEDAQRWGDALEKLTRVAKVKLTPGVLYHTALCEEHLGHLVAAMRDYKAAASQAHAEGASDVLRLVDKRIVDSTARISHLVVVVPGAAGAVVRVDGDTITPGVAIEADPGPHTLETDAPGCSRSVTSVTLREGEATSLEVKLEPAIPPPPASVEPVGPPKRQAEVSGGDPASRTRTVALVESGAAIALAAGGIGAYLVAGGQHSRSVADCAQVVSPRPGACDSEKNAVRAWDWVAVGAWTGAVAAGALAVLSFERLHHRTARDDRSARIYVTPASVGVEGSF